MQSSAKEDDEHSLLSERKWLRLAPFKNGTVSARLTALAITRAERAFLASEGTAAGRDSDRGGDGFIAVLGGRVQEWRRSSVAIRVQTPGEAQTL